MLLTLAGMVIAFVPSAFASGLGITLEIEQAGETDAESSGRIWGGGEAGTSFTRKIFIQSLSTDTDQQISFEVNDQVTENGESFIDFAATSRIAEWVRFEPAVPIIRPGEQVAVTVTFSIPDGTPDGAVNANIRTFSSAASPQESDSNAGTQAVIGTRLAIDARVWVGVGDALALAPIFDIIGVDGALIEQQKHVRVFFENTGITPVRPSGRLQLSDPNFVDRVFEPVNFELPQIDGGEIAFVDVPVSSDVEDGFFRVFVTAQSSEVRITRLFEAELLFDDPNKLSIPDLVIRLLVFLVASIGLVVGVRMIRSGGSKVKSETKAPKDANPLKPSLASRLRQLSQKKVLPPTQPTEDPIEVLQAMVARMEQKIEELNREAPPAPRRRAPAKPKPKLRASASKSTVSSSSATTRAKKPIAKAVQVAPSSTSSSSSPKSSSASTTKPAARASAAKKPPVKKLPIKTAAVGKVKKTAATPKRKAD
jgi:hypothetical protein